jgi:hypothetical protein
MCRLHVQIGGVDSTWCYAAGTNNEKAHKNSGRYAYRSATASKSKIGNEFPCIFNQHSNTADGLLHTQYAHQKRKFNRALRGGEQVFRRMEKFFKKQLSAYVNIDIFGA